MGPIWAELGEAAGYASAAAVICTALVSGAVVLVKLLDSSRASAKQQKRIEALEAHAAESDDAYLQLAHEASDCHAASAILHDFAGRCARALRALGQDPGEVPRLPPRPDRGAVEFRERSLAQQAALVRGKLPAVPPSAQTGDD